MIHDSWVILTLISICNSWIDLLYPIHTLLLYMLSVRSMNHESRILNHPTSNPDEDAHTIAPINPWKFQSDWSSHVRAYSGHSAGNGLSPHTPLYTYASCAGWMIICFLEQEMTRISGLSHFICVGYFWATNPLYCKRRNLSEFDDSGHHSPM